MIYMAEPPVSGLVDKLSNAIKNKIITNGKLMTFDPLEFHDRIGKMYSWITIARQTIYVYEEVLKKKRLTLLEQFARYRTVGSFAGIIACILAVTLHFYVTAVEFWQPQTSIDVVPDLKCDGTGILFDTKCADSSCENFRTKKLQREMLAHSK